MHDLKNILLAWVSSVSAVFTAIEGRSFFTILSAVLLPTLFFMLGKAVDVAVQFYFRLREERRTGGEVGNSHESAEQTAIEVATGEAKLNL